jgi:hypothetical protein
MTDGATTVVIRKRFAVRKRSSHTHEPSGRLGNYSCRISVDADFSADGAPQRVQLGLLDPDVVEMKSDAASLNRAVAETVNKYPK